MRTKNEVIDFLEGLVGGGVECKGNPSLNSQCVTLIKALMEFLGVQNPYKARGNAKTAINAYISEGIADPGIGYLSVFSNKNMGGGYGHIWVNAGDGDGEFYESNGQKALTVTKGKTYSYDNVCNFDKYIGEDMNDDLNKILDHYGVKTADELISMVDEQFKFLEDERAKNKNLEKELLACENLLKSCETKLEECGEGEYDSEWEADGKSVTTVDGNKTTTVNYKLK